MENTIVLRALDELHLEINKLVPAIKHIEELLKVTEVVKGIPNKHLELIKILKDEFTLEINRITEEIKKIIKTNSSLLEEIKTLLENLNKSSETIRAFYEKIVQINFPERLDKLDANVAGIMAAVQSIQSRLDLIERNLSDKLRDLERNLSDKIRDLSDKQKEGMLALKNSMDASTKKQQTFNYLTWALIVVGIVAIIILCKK